jgi:hypothetical protein
MEGGTLRPVGHLCGSRSGPAHMARQRVLARTQCHAVHTAWQCGDSGVETQGLLRVEPRGSGFETRHEPRGSGFETRHEPRGSGFETRHEPRGSGFETRHEPRGSGIE